MTDWITIHHPEIGATAVVAREALAVYGGKGWVEGSLPAKEPEKKAVAKKAADSK